MVLLGFQDCSNQIQMILINTKENLMLLNFAVAILISSLQKKLHDVMIQRHFIVYMISVYDKWPSVLNVLAKRSGGVLKVH